MKNLFSEFHSRATGLTAAEVLARRAKFGANELEVKQPEPWWKKLFRQFSDILVIILLLAGILALFLGEEIDAIVILVIVVINALIGFVQEFKTERMLDALQKLVALNSKVLRNGKIQLIPAHDVVVGDILILEEGMKLPADAILLEANELKIDEAILTGESIPVHKVANSKDEHEGKVFSSTEIVNGGGKALCCAVGRETEFGKIAKLTTSTKKSESPLTKEMKTIGAFVGKVALVISIILFLLGFYVKEYTLIQSLLFAVAVAVAAVPEGLPVTITTALALGMRRLADKKALVKDLKSVETLGATTVICSDKTGTLTRNQMVVHRGWLPSAREFPVSGVGYDPRNGKVEITKNSDSTKLFEIADAVNDAELQKKGRIWKILGDPTEGALRVVARKFGIKKSWKRAETFPFDSNRKRMSVLVDTLRQAQGREVLAKGGVEAILSQSTHFLENGKIKKLTPQIRKKIHQTSEGFAADALRVLGFAYKPLTPEISRGLTMQTAEQKLIFVGMLGMYDSPRSEVKAAVDSCKRAGIRITIITGDFGITAKAIAKELGIADDTTRVITGDELKKLKDAALKKILRQKENIIFARVKPADKLRIVEMYKKLGEVVAVTGDGVNDAPALKRADIGVAMGRCGADVAKEAASLVLTDDSFASIVSAVAEGRRLYNNMKKFIAYTFSCNIGELIVIFLAILLNVPLPLTAILVLLVNLETDLLPSLALGIGPADPEAMREPPRDPRQRILRGRLVWHLVWIGVVIALLTLGGYLGVLLQNGWSFGSQLIENSQLHIRGMSFAFATLVVIQIFNAFNFHSNRNSAFSDKIRKNNWLWGASLVSVILVVVVVEVPSLQGIFGTTGLSVSEWLAVVVLSGSVLLFEEMRKLLLNLKLKISNQK